MWLEGGGVKGKVSRQNNLVDGFSGWVTNAGAWGIS
jgi:hypothetical protein